MELIPYIIEGNTKYYKKEVIKLVLQEKDVIKKDNTEVKLEKRHKGRSIYTIERKMHLKGDSKLKVSVSIERNRDNPLLVLHLIKKMMNEILMN
jgi:hypothetical protein